MDVLNIWAPPDTMKAAGCVRPVQSNTGSEGSRVASAGPWTIRAAAELKHEPTTAEEPEETPAARPSAPHRYTLFITQEVDPV